MNFQIFTAHLKQKKGVESFHLLSPYQRHADSPRLTEDGETLVFFDNPIGAFDGTLVPGAQSVSRRLMKLNLEQGIAAAEQAAENGILEIDIADMIVDQVRVPVMMHDGNQFNGLYPKLPLPDRCFSSDHIFYVTFYEGASTRMAAIDINTKQVNTLLLRLTNY